MTGPELQPLLDYHYWARDRILDAAGRLSPADDRREKRGHHQRKREGSRQFGLRPTEITLPFENQSGKGIEHRRPDDGLGRGERPHNVSIRSGCRAAHALDNITGSRPGSGDFPGMVNIAEMLADEGR